MSSQIVKNALLNVSNAKAPHRHTMGVCGSKPDDKPTSLRLNRSDAVIPNDSTVLKSEMTASGCNDHSPPSVEHFIQFRADRTYVPHNFNKSLGHMALTTAFVPIKHQEALAMIQAYDPHGNWWRKVRLFLSDTHEGGC